jgi:hypothetical protein
MWLIVSNHVSAFYWLVTFRAFNFAASFWLPFPFSFITLSVHDLSTLI